MNVKYNDKAFKEVMSINKGDGGLIEGGLVFSEDIEVFVGKPYKSILKELTKGKFPDVVNLGGPAVVALAHASQILNLDNVEVSFYGAVGDDKEAEKVRSAINSTPLIPLLHTIKDQRTATTDVFDDPSQRNGKGERSFINTIGAANYFDPEALPPSFYDADIVLLGGTALVPPLHDGLHFVLEQAKEKGCITVVGTVYDFRNEKKSPTTNWPLGKKESYPLIDLLITDEKEALRLSGTQKVEDAAAVLISYGLSALIITRGALDMLVYSNGNLISPSNLLSMPVSHYMDDLMEKDPSLRKDTTGCGDNFVGGVLVALAKHQLKHSKEQITMSQICAYGAASGGLTCTYHGGTYYEKESGEKAKLLKPVVEAYLKSLEKL
jgi:sugar/nucleoside kinase (ribokinase family)